MKDRFDAYAASYDQHMTEALAYRGPQLLRDAIEQLGIAEGSPGAVLDVGCGTGLCGALFRHLATRLVGVDVSQAMVELARARGVYDALVVGDFRDTVRGATGAFDLIVAADVLGYVADLGDVFAGCAGALASGGRFAFTTEAAAGDAPWRYLPGGRFAHARAHVEREAARAGLQVEHIDTAQLRTEGGVPVVGHVGVLRRAPIT